VTTHPSVGRLEADNAVRRRREADGAAGVGPDGSMTEPGGRRHARPARRHARPAVLVPRVAGHTEAGVIPAHRPFREIQLAEHDRPGLTKLRHHCRIERRDELARRSSSSTRPYPSARRNRRAAEAGFIGHLRRRARTQGGRRPTLWCVRPEQVAPRSNGAALSPNAPGSPANDEDVPHVVSPGAGSRRAHHRGGSWISVSGSGVAGAFSRKRWPSGDTA
jgi:hypothetical protein